MGKSLKGTTVEEWRAHVIEFNYRGKAYSVPVDGNLILKTLSVVEVKKYLNEIPARLAYWKDMQVEVELKLADMEEDYEIWFQRCYMDVDATAVKKTETWKKAEVVLKNAVPYRKWRKGIRDLQNVRNKLSVIVTCYNTMTWTLREIARLTYIEMSNIELKGKGSLADIR